MLILTRKLGEVINIGDSIRVVVVSVSGKQIRLGIEAPANLSVHRQEVYERIINENKLAAQNANSNIKPEKELSSLIDAKNLDGDKNNQAIITINKTS